MRDNSRYINHYGLRKPYLQMIRIIGDVSTKQTQRTIMNSEVQYTSMLIVLWEATQT